MRRRDVHHAGDRPDIGSGSVGDGRGFHEGVQARPIFAQQFERVVLPDTLPAAFEIALAKLKLSADDAFGLLLALCRDCHGAVHIEPATDSDG